MTDTTEQVHSEWGGSVAYRVKNCAGSVAINRTVPKRPGGYAAEEGTWMHALAAFCLMQNRRTCSAFVHVPLPDHVEVPIRFVGSPFGHDRVAAVQEYLDAVWEEFDLSPGATLLIEVDVELGIEGVFGRLDAAVWHPTLRRLRGFDLKCGEGMEVDAEDNDQPQFYTVGLLLGHPDWKPEQVILSIVQSRHWKAIAGVKPAVQDWEIHPADLAIWLDDYTDAVERSKAEIDTYNAACEATADPLLTLNLTPGPWCDKTFCDAMATCPAHESRALAAVQAGFKGVITDMRDATTVDLLMPSELDIERLEKMAGAAKMLAAYAQKCEDYLYGLAMSGQELKLHKLVDKIGRRKYVVADEDVVEFLDVMFGVPADVSTRTQLQTLTEMKKILKQHGATPAHIEDFELRFTLKESSGQTLAPISDKRPAVVLAQKAFGSVNLPTA